MSTYTEYSSKAIKQAQQLLPDMCWHCVYLWVLQLSAHMQALRHILQQGTTCENNYYAFVIDQVSCNIVVPWISKVLLDLYYLVQFYIFPEGIHTTARGSTITICTHVEPVVNTLWSLPACTVHILCACACSWQTTSHPSSNAGRSFSDELIFTMWSSVSQCPLKESPLRMEGWL